MDLETACYIVNYFPRLENQHGKAALNQINTHLTGWMRFFEIMPQAITCLSFKYLLIYKVIFKNFTSPSSISKWYFNITGLPGNVPEFSAVKILTFPFSS